MSSSEPVFRLHEQTYLRRGETSVPVDRGLARTVAALWQLKIETQSCCEQDYAIIGERPVTSEHAYIGFTGTSPLCRFLEILEQRVEDREAFHSRLAAAAVAEPGRGREVETYEEFPLLTMAGRWTSSNKLWVISDGLLLVTTYVAFPRQELSWIEAAAVAAAEQGGGSDKVPDIG